jgi:hypothetical protein
VTSLPYWLLARPVGSMRSPVIRPLFSPVSTVIGPRNIEAILSGHFCMHNARVRHKFGIFLMPLSVCTLYGSAIYGTVDEILLNCIESSFGQYRKLSDRGWPTMSTDVSSGFSSKYIFLLGKNTTNSQHNQTWPFPPRSVNHSGQEQRGESRVYVYMERISSRYAKPILA